MVVKRTFVKATCGRLFITQSKCIGSKLGLAFLCLSYSVFSLAHAVHGMSTSLPRTIQDLEAKERYAARQRSSWLHSRRMRVLCIVGILFTGTLALMLHFGDPTQVPGFKRLRTQDDGAAVAAMDAEDNNAVVAHDNVVKDETPSNMSPLALELTTIVAQHPLTVFSKTYCP